jgi:hypothetical protein
MKKVMAALLLVQSTAFASSIPVGSEIVIQQDIHFPDHTTLVWLQDGRVTGKEVDSYHAHCALTDISLKSFYNVETGLNAPIAKGESYFVEEVWGDRFLKNPSTGRVLSLECDRSVNFYNRIVVDKISNGHLNYIGNSPAKFKTIQKITSGVLEFKI